MGLLECIIINIFICFRRSVWTGIILTTLSSVRKNFQKRKGKTYIFCTSLSCKRTLHDLIVNNSSIPFVYFFIFMFWPCNFLSKCHNSIFRCNNDELNQIPPNIFFFNVKSTIIFISAGQWLIVINHIQNKGFCVIYVCVLCIFIMCIYIYI